MAQNYADKETDKRLAEMENYLRSLYSKAAKEVGEVVKDYFEKLPKRYVKEFEAFQNGEYTVEQFAAWFNSQIGRGERWKSLKDNLVKQAVKVNEKAAEYVNGNTTEIYTMNANYTAYEIEKAVNVSGKSMGVSFDLVDESTVKRLSTGKNHTEFRTLSVNRKRDYEWNFKKAQNSILSSILQGKDMNGIAKSLFQDVMHNNQTATIRNARTAVTSAQNGGRLDTYLAAQAQGLNIQKEWICTHDDRTRQSHLNLDGVRVGINEEFPNGCKYPGDPDGAPAEVYNCRCTMRSVIAGYDQEKAHETGNTAESYKKWMQSKSEYEGVPKTWKRGESIKELNGINAHKGDKNCVSCCYAYEMRCRGYSVTAKKEKIKSIAKAPSSGWIDPDVQEIKRGENGRSTIEAYAATQGTECRIQVWGNWLEKDTGIYSTSVPSGHSFIAEWKDGRFTFLDVQNEVAYNEDILNEMQQESIKYCRIDNLEINDRGATTCEKIESKSH